MAIKAIADLKPVLPSVVSGYALPAEIFTAPVEDSANGIYHSNVSIVIEGMEFEGFTFTIENGTTVKVEVEKGKAEHIKRLQDWILDDKYITGERQYPQVKGLNRWGEMAIGFNRKIGKLLGEKTYSDLLITEKMDVHAACGSSYVPAGGKNKCSKHIDFVTESGPGLGFTVSDAQTLDELKNSAEILYQDGLFTDAFLNKGLNSSPRVDVKTIQAYINEDE